VLRVTYCVLRICGDIGRATAATFTQKSSREMVLDLDLDVDLDLDLDRALDVDLGPSSTGGLYRLEIIFCYE
jgi:hypothetical protein